MDLQSRFNSFWKNFRKLMQLLHQLLLQLSPLSMLKLTVHLQYDHLLHRKRCMSTFNRVSTIRRGRRRKGKVNNKQWRKYQWCKSAHLLLIRHQLVCDKGKSTRAVFILPVRHPFLHLLPRLMYLWDLAECCVLLTQLIRLNEAQ